MFCVSTRENICCIADMKLQCSPEISVQSVDIHVSYTVSLFCGWTSVELTLLDVVVVLIV